MLDALLPDFPAHTASDPSAADERHAAWLDRVARSMGFLDAEATILDVSSDGRRCLIEGTAHRTRAWVSVSTRTLTLDGAADRIGRRLRRRL